MDDPTDDLAGPGPRPPQRPIGAAVGRIGRPSKPNPGPNPPSKPTTELSYNIRHYTRNPIKQWSSAENPQDEEYKAKKSLHEAYMRTQLWGFIINELQDGGCWDDPNAIPLDLYRFGSIHPIFKYETWETGQGCEDIGKGYPGKWDVRGNQTVRDALNPSLYLASLLLTHSATWTWFDALLFSPRKEVTPANLKDTKDGCDPGKIAYRTFEFRARDPISVQRSQETFETYAASLQAKLTLCIKSAVLRAEKAGNNNLIYRWHRPSYTMIESGAVYTEDYTGVTHLSSEIVLPLLRSDLTISERLVRQFCVAKTLVHETMVRKLA
ncbi:hypothetical protein DL98DRAFT_591223 [Cadophora sp. DSE1049]|nr:hypothetical protein DL98DRAFT_591223 [Cadophora sp. DSE1049]